MRKNREIHNIRGELSLIKTFVGEVESITEPAEFFVFKKKYTHHVSDAIGKIELQLNGLAKKSLLQCLGGEITWFFQKFVLRTNRL